MNTFLRSVNGRAVRRYLNRNRYPIRIVDFRGHQVFKSKNTYTCLFFLEKRNGIGLLQYYVDEHGHLPEIIHYTAINYENLDDDKGWTLNDFETNTAIETVGLQIKDYCPSRHGIATLNNDTYIFKPVEENERYLILKSNNCRFPIEKELCRDIVNPNKLNSTTNINTILEKVIFPYRIDGGRAYVYEPSEMRQRFPKAYAYLKSKKDVLSNRDKGKAGKYAQWYAYGRTQSLIMPRYKLFFPKFANRPLRCVICDNSDLMLYNGLAFVNNDLRRLQILKKIIESSLFWKYIQANGKPYASGYYSLSGVDIKHFGIPMFTVEEEDELLAIDNQHEIEEWLNRFYF